MWKINIGDTIICKDGSKYTACRKEDVPSGLDNEHVHKYTFVGVRVINDCTFWNGWYKGGNALLHGAADLDIEQVIPKEKPVQAKQPRKHSELIKAWADGAEIQYKSQDGLWYDLYAGNNVTWYDGGQYRIKPEVKPDVVTLHYATSHHVFKQLEDERYPDNLKLTFDGETGKLKSAEVIETE